MHNIHLPGILLNLPDVLVSRQNLIYILLSHFSEDMGLVSEVSGALELKKVL